MTIAKAWVVTVCCFTVGGSAGLGRAEDAPFPALGSRVRVYSLALRSTPLVGTLTAVDQKSLTVVGPKDAREPSVVARGEVSRLEWSVKPSRKKKGAFIGLGVGFGLGVAGTFILCESFGTSCPTGEGIGYALFIFGPATGAAGAGIGALVAPGERWADVPIDLVHSADRTERPPAGIQLTILPLVGHRRGLTIVASFR